MLRIVTVWINGRKGLCHDYDCPKKNREEQGGCCLGYKAYSDELFLIDCLFFKAVLSVQKNCTEFKEAQIQGSTKFPCALLLPTPHRPAPCYCHLALV